MLSKFPNKTLKVGAKVSLSPQHQWRIGDANPVGISGIVSYVSQDHVYGMIRVVWENERSNTYNNSDYDLIAEGELGYLETYF